ncbi:MAG: hypothetical protein ABIG89_07640, partial [Candidatus Woesearchaeota archaeon]
NNNNVNVNNIIDTKQDTDTISTIKPKQSIHLLYDAKDRARLNPYSYGEAINTQAELIRAGLNYIDDITSLSPSDFINPFKYQDGESPIYILDISICSIWQPPRLKQDCEQCSKNPYRPCTEYLCRSLGQQCIFDYNYGNPVCKQKKLNDKQPPVISIDYDALSKGFEIKEVSIEKDKTIKDGRTIKGYRIEPKLKPHKPFTLGIKANEPVTCKLSLMPFKKFSELGGIYFGQQTFAVHQNITIRTPPNIIIPKNTLDILNISNYQQISNVLDGPEEFIDSYKQKYKTAITLYETFSGKDIIKNIKPFTDMIKGFIKKFDDNLPYIKLLTNTSLSKLENNTYMMFIRCMDESGNENIDPPFIEFSIEDKDKKGIDEAEIDSTPAEIIGFLPENNTQVSTETYDTRLSLFLDEPAECRYDSEDKRFNLMNYSFSCTIDDYEISSNFGGTYECTGKVFIPLEETEIFIRCRDNPIETRQYYFYVEDGTEQGIFNLTSDIFFNFTSPNKIYSPISLFEEKHMKFLVDSFTSNISEMELHLFKDNLNPCSYDIISEEFISNEDINDKEISDKEFTELNTYNTSNKTKRQTGKLNNCLRTDDVHLGVYECVEMIDLWKEDKDIIKKVKYNITFNCPNKVVSQQNRNEESYYYVLKKSTGFEITETAPIGEINSNTARLEVNTTQSKDVNCRYKREFGLSYKDMIFVKDTKSKDDKESNEYLIINNNNNNNKESDYSFYADIEDLNENLNSYVVKCTDAYDNSAEEKIEFYVIK